VDLEVPVNIRPGPAIDVLVHIQALTPARLLS
jgi:hypothetical protein